MNPLAPNPGWSPQSPLEFFQPTPSQPITPVIFDEDENGWWAGVQMCAATVAIAATLAITATSTVEAQAVASGFTDDPIQTTTGNSAVNSFTLFTQQNAITVRYIPADDEFPSVVLVDEDYWQDSVAPVVAANFQNLPYLPDPEELPAGTLFGQPGEDYWINPVPPVAAYPPPSRTYLPDPEEIPAGTLFNQPDEDFWRYSVTQPTQWTSLLFSTSASIPPPICIDEDFWVSGVAPIAAYPVPFVFIDDDIPPASAISTDEDFWSNPVPPVAGILGRLYLPDAEELPAGKLFGQPDEDFWRNPVAPVFAYPPPQVFNIDDVTAFPTLSADEDFWRYSVTQPTQWTSLLFSTSASIPTPVAQAMDEDFWINPVAPVPSYPVPLVFRDDDIITQQPLTIGVDEDFWANSVSPVAGSNFLEFPYVPDPEEIPAGSLVGPVTNVVEEEGQPRRIIAPTAWTSLLYRSSAFGNQATTPPTIDDTQWFNFIPPWNVTPFGSLYLPDPEEIPAGSLVGPTVGQPDEDFWRNPVAPVPGANFVKLPYVPDPEEIPAGSLVGPPPLPMEEDSVPLTQLLFDPLTQLLFFLDDGSSITAFQADEDYWRGSIALVAPVPSYPVPKLFSDDDVITQPPAVTNTDEDFWSNPVAPVPATLLPLYLPDPEELPALFLPPLIGEPDEDFWRNPVAPVPGANFVKLPYVPDPEEIPAGKLAGLPDEDFWQNPTPPVAGTQYQRLPYGSLLDPDEIPLGGLSGQPDEDYWINPVAPVPASLWQELPYLPDPESLPGSLSVLTDEDFWVNPVAPVTWNNLALTPLTEDDLIVFGMEEEFWQNPAAPTAFYTPPVAAFTDDEIIFVPPPIPDEDFWVSGVAPIFSYPVPLVFTDDELKVIQILPPEEDFWVSGVAPIAASMYQPLPYVPDPEQQSTIFPLSVIGSGDITPITGVSGTATIVQGADNFNYPGPNLNPGWVTMPGADAFLVDQPNASVYTKSSPNFTTFLEGAILNISAGPDQFAQATVTRLPNPNPNPPERFSFLGITVRQSFDSANRTITSYEFEAGNDGRYSLIWNIGVPTNQTLDSPGIFPTMRDYVRDATGNPSLIFRPIHVGDVLRLEVRGNVLTAYLNGAILFGPVVDNHVGTGQPGLQGYAPSNVTPASLMELGSFSAGALTATIVPGPGRVIGKGRID